MKTVTLENIQNIVGDLQSVARGYINQTTIDDAQKLAKAAVRVHEFGRMGYLSAVGSPHDWWAQNCSVYADLASSPVYEKARRFSHLLEIAEYLVIDDRRDCVESRWTSLELMRKRFGLEEAEDKEFVLLSNWLGYPAKL